MEKLKNYNQKMLAILGTVLLIMAAFGLILLIYYGVSEMYRDWKYSQQHDGILSEDEVEVLKKENKRYQLVSYDIPQLVDSVNMIYMLPVSQKTLNEPEEISSESYELLDVFDEGNRISKNHYTRRYSGSFNNLLIYDLKNKAMKKLFDHRLSIRNIDVKYFEDEILLLFTAADSDTYEDGLINYYDRNSLFIYSIGKKELKNINVEEFDAYSYEFIPNSKNLMIKFGRDQNMNGTYSEYDEPSVIKHYNLETGELTNLVDPKINEELQKLIEGN